jgi:TPR repeat protein
VDEPTSVAGVDPSRVNTPAELAACLNGLRRRRGLSYEAMEKAAKKLPRPGEPAREALAKSTVGEIVTGKRLPTTGKLRTFLAVCQVSRADVPQWLAAWERASTADLTRPADAVRVREAKPRQLGVHAAIQIDGATGDLPLYVPRDFDAGLTAALTAAAKDARFVLLVGRSSAGKTRALYEAVLATLPDWWLVHPDGPGVIRGLAAAPTSRTVVWLDELQRYLGADGGLTAGTARALLRAGMVIVGTMWPDEYGIRIAPRQPGSDDQHAGNRELLDLAHVFDVADAFNAGEHARARGLAAVDGRIRAALDSPDTGLTQVLVAGPELVRWWEQAPNPYAKAVITAAVDARLLGAGMPVTAEFLADAALGYLKPAERASAPDDWLRHALAYAITPLHGAASALTPVDSGTMGRVAGYISADYLFQHGQAVRRGVVPPVSLWKSAVDHLNDLGDRTRLGWSAQHRCLNRYAALLFEPTAVRGDVSAMRGLARTLLQAGEIDEAAIWLRRAAEAGVPDAPILARELERCGLAVEAEALLLRAATAGKPAAAYELAKRLDRNDRREDGDRMMLQAASLAIRRPCRASRKLWRRQAA